MSKPINFTVLIDRKEGGELVRGFETLGEAEAALDALAREAGFVDGDEFPWFAIFEGNTDSGEPIVGGGGAGFRVGDPNVL